MYKTQTWGLPDGWHTFLILRKTSNKLQQCIKRFSFHIYMKLYIFRANTAHYQEPKTALAASGFFTWKVVGRVVDGRCKA
jgi:hypothetical protein